MRNHPLARFFHGVWRGLDGLRRVLHLVLLLILALFLLAVFSPSVPVVPRTAALVVAPRGVIVEQLAGDPVQRAFAELSGDEEQQTLLRDVLDAIAAAKDDDRIQALMLDLNEMTGGGLSKLEAIAGALEDFKAAGKRVVAISGNYGQQQYLLAAHADEVYVHPYGSVFLDGFAYYRTYYKDAIDKLLIDWNVFKVGPYKSYADPYLRNDMSPEDERASLAWLSDLWSSYQRDVTGARKLEPGALQSYATGLVSLLRDHHGDMAQLALDAGLVDGVWHYDQVRARLVELVGEDPDEAGSFNQVGFTDYLKAVRAKEAVIPGDGDQVGIIVASGTILEGNQPPGTIGSDSLVDLIRDARDDEAVKAVVLRIDSGGGSVFASEVIRRELENLRAAGKPVIASMSSVAASGGYWIAMPADQIVANDTTLTGSIGIIAMFPTVQRTLGKLGISVDGIGTTPLSGDFRFDRELGESARDILTLSIENGYREFITKVAAARGKPVEAVNKVAGGRVWSGEDALALGLVDRLGDIGDAVTAAADMAGLGEDYSVRYIEPELSFGERIAIRLASTARAAVGVGVRSRRPGAVVRAFDSIVDQLALLGRLNDPRNMYSLCFCTIE